MKEVIKILESFEKDLEDGWDYAFEQLDERYQDNEVVFESDYGDVIRDVIKVYYKAYSFMVANDFDFGLTYEIRQRQVDLLLGMLKELNK